MLLFFLQWWWWGEVWGSQTQADLQPHHSENIPGIMCRLKYNIPYSGKLSTEKTFANLRFCGYLRKFSLQNLEVWHLWCCKSEQSVKVFFAKIIFFTNLRKFSPSKVSCYMVSFICAGMIHGLNPLCLEVIEITRKNWIFVGSTNTAGLHCRNLPHKLYYKNRVPMQRIILKGVTCFSF